MFSWCKLEIPSGEVTAKVPWKMVEIISGGANLSVCPPAGRENTERKTDCPSSFPQGNNSMEGFGFELVILISMGRQS